MNVPYGGTYNAPIRDTTKGVSQAEPHNYMAEGQQANPSGANPSGANTLNAREKWRVWGQAMAPASYRRALFYRNQMLGAKAAQQDASVMGGVNQHRMDRRTDPNIQGPKEAAKEGRPSEGINYEALLQPQTGGQGDPSGGMPEPGGAAGITFAGEGPSGAKRGRSPGSTGAPMGNRPRDPNDFTGGLGEAGMHPENISDNIDLAPLMQLGQEQEQQPSELRKWGIPFQGGLTPMQRLQMKQGKGGR